MGILESIILAVSLCADCFAVSLCSSVTLKQIKLKPVVIVALSFAVIQTLLLTLGWAFGSVFAGVVGKVAHIIGFLLLLYVGGSMLKEGIEGIAKGVHEVRDLNGFRNIVIGGIATSIDAIAVGAAQSLAGVEWMSFLPLFVAVFVVTALSVVAGIWGGKTVGCRFGHWAEIAGGLVLIGIGVSLLF